MTLTQADLDDAKSLIKKSSQENLEHLTQLRYMSEKELKFCVKRLPIRARSRSPSRTRRRPSNVRRSTSRGRRTSHCTRTLDDKVEPLGLVSRKKIKICGETIKFVQDSQVWKKLYPASGGVSDHRHVPVVDSVR